MTGDSYMISLFDVEYEPFEVFSFGVVDVDGVVLRLLELVQDTHFSSADGSCGEHRQSEHLFAYRL